jgi:hypothetical protein
MSRTRLPWIAVSLSLCALAIQRIPDLASWLEFDLKASLEGEIWRPWTGHLCHYNQSHFVGDVAAFLVWASAAELISRRLLVTAWLGTSALLATWLVLFGGITLRYRGLSAIDCALATQIVIIAYRFAKAHGRQWLCGTLIGVSVLMLGKSLYEFATGHAILAPDLGTGVRLLPAAHIVGVLVGAVTAGCWNARVSCQVRPAPDQR